MKRQGARRRSGNGGRGKQGARQHRTVLSEKLRSWLRHHREVARDSLRRLLSSPASTLMTWLVIGIALALPGAFQLALDNLDGLAGDWGAGSQLSLFLRQDVSPERRNRLVQDLSSRGDIERVELVTPESALQELSEEAGFADVLEGLSGNPLPAVVVVLPRAGVDLTATTAGLQRQLGELPEVERVVVDMQWLQRLRELMTLADRAALVLAVLLSAGVVLVLGNTIRLEIENRRDEIQVVKLVGGTDAFVRRPFLYMGLWYGLGGGITAVILVLATSLWLGEPLGRLLELYGGGLRPRGPGPGLLSVLTAGAALLGLFGAWFGVGRHLDRLDPR